MPIRRALGNAALSGWLSGQVSGGLEDVLLIVNSEGVIVGLARMLDRPLDPLGLRSGARVSWSGYARTQAGALDVLAIAGDGSLCSVFRDEPSAEEPRGRAPRDARR